MTMSYWINFFFRPMILAEYQHHPKLLNEWWIKILMMGLLMVRSDQIWSHIFFWKQNFSNTEYTVAIPLLVILKVIASRVDKFYLKISATGELAIFMFFSIEATDWQTFSPKSKNMFSFVYGILTDKYKHNLSTYGFSQLFQYSERFYCNFLGPFVMTSSSINPIPEYFMYVGKLAKLP